MAQGATVFLLGAGASVAAGIPASREMTKAIVERVTGNDFGHRHPMSQAINYVLATANAAQTLEGGNAFGTVDVERLFSTIQMLADRRTHEASPFVTWDPVIEQMDRAANQPPNAGPINKALNQALVSPVHNLALAQALATFIDSRLGSGDGALYRRIQKSMLGALRQVVHVSNPESVDYLAPIVTEQDCQSDAVVVATLNYDRTIEILAHKLRIPCDTGIEPWSETGRFIQPSSGIFLLKLHGSIDWVFESTDPPSGTVEPDGVLVVDDPLKEQRRPSALVFGERNKLTADGPFLDLLVQFREEMKRADRLVVVGYSFRDAHINEMIRRWIKGDWTRRIVVIDPGFSRKGFQGELSRLLAAPPPSGHVPSPPPGQVTSPRITVIQKKAEEGLAGWSTM